MNAEMKKILMIMTLLMSMSVINAQEIQSFTVKVGDFTQLSVVDDINVVYECKPDSTGYAKFTADTDMANQMIFTNNKKGKLSISVGSDSVYTKHLPTIVVYSAFLQSAENFGDSTLHVKSIAPAPKMKFKLVDNGSIVADKVETTDLTLEILTGKGLIQVNGKCTDLNVKNTGKGTIKTEELLAENVNCRIVGTGKVYCHVNGGSLMLKGTGTGKLYYKGKPSSVKQRQLGTLKAISLDETKEQP